MDVFWNKPVFERLCCAQHWSLSYWRVLPLLKSRGLIYMISTSLHEQLEFLWQLVTSKVRYGRPGTLSLYCIVGKYQAVIHNCAHKKCQSRVERAFGSNPEIVNEAPSPLEFVIKPRLLLFIPQSLCNLGAKFCLFSITAATIEGKKCCLHSWALTFSPFPVWPD